MIDHEREFPCRYGGSSKNEKQLSWLAYLRDLEPASISGSRLIDGQLKYMGPQC